MMKKLASTVSDADVAARTEDLKALAKSVHSAARDLGLAESGCRTVCEERLVVVNGKLRREVVCHTVC